MTNIRRQISISCGPEKVFGVLSDIDRLAEFSHTTVGVSKSQGRALAVGDHFDQVVKVLNIDVDTEWEVTELVPDQTIRVEGPKANGSATVVQQVAA